MATLLYLLARAVVGVLQALPLRLVARLGRAAGALAYVLDARHRRVTIANLTLCFGREKPPVEIRGLARENFRRVGESYCCAIKTAAMSDEEVRQVLEVMGVEKIYRLQPGQPLESRLMCIGHFGNFELYARCATFVPGYRFATTYRALRQPALNRLLQDLREQSGCVFFERRTDSDALKAALSRGGLVLGLLADQHAGDKGLRLPFFGHDCSTNAAPAVLALRYRCPIFTAFCYRTGLARWRIEVGDEIPARENGQPRPVEAIMRDMNHAFETAIRRDPANWFWVHKRWKPEKLKNPKPASANTAKDSTTANSCNSQ
jgi:KDO2-lipid IV(A) lauroyltransferase